MPYYINRHANIIYTTKRVTYIFFFFSQDKERKLEKTPITTGISFVLTTRQDKSGQSGQRDGWNNSVAPHTEF